VNQFHCFTMGMGSRILPFLPILDTGVAALPYWHRLTSSLPIREATGVSLTDTHHGFYPKSNVMCTICFTICLFIGPDLDGHRICFTICLFIGPDLDGYRAP
jgi:hypothetical protein